jgi:hypothetical protein
MMTVRPLLFNWTLCFPFAKQLTSMLRHRFRIDGRRTEKIRSLSFAAWWGTGKISQSQRAPLARSVDPVRAFRLRRQCRRYEPLPRPWAVYRPLCDRRLTVTHQGECAAVPQIPTFIRMSSDSSHLRCGALRTELSGRSRLREIDPAISRSPVQCAPFWPAGSHGAWATIPLTPRHPSAKTRDCTSLGIWEFPRRTTRVDPCETM